jgi:predicted methyltransferase
MAGSNRTPSAIRRRARSAPRRARASARRRAEIAAAAAAMIATFVVVVVTLTELSKAPRRSTLSRNRLHLRERRSVQYVSRFFSDQEFARALRMDREAFYKLVEIIRPGLERDGSRPAAIQVPDA